MAENLFRNYRCKYVWTPNGVGGYEKHHFEVIGARGGLHLHITDLGEEKQQDRWSAGLEEHWRSPPPYMDDRAPSHDVCWLLHCPCWHDGTSLYAMETLLPLFLQIQATPQMMLQRLCTEAEERFKRYDE